MMGIIIYFDFGQSLMWSLEIAVRYVNVLIIFQMLLLPGNNVSLYFCLISSLNTL